MDQADQILRLRKLTTIYWMLGMSLRSVVIALASFGVKHSHMTVWRDLQEQAGLSEKCHHSKTVRALGLDDAYIRAWRVVA